MQWCAQEVGACYTRARICRPFEEPSNRFPGWRARTTSLLFVPARRATFSNGIDFSESIPGLHKRLQIWAQTIICFGAQSPDWPESSFISILCKLWKSCWLIFGGICKNFKGSLTRDFRLQVFFINQCPPGLWVSNWDRLEFFRKFAEIIANECLSAVSTTPAKKDKNFERSVV
jgi:hypothetical protein